jgi:hypothetical protein
VCLPPETLAFPPWQQQLVALALQVLSGQEPSLAQLVSLCMWPEVQQFTTYRVGSGLDLPLLPAGCQVLYSQQVAYTHIIWRARLLVGGVWSAVSLTTDPTASVAALFLHTGGECCWVSCCIHAM